MSLLLLCFLKLLPLSGQVWATAWWWCPPILESTTTWSSVLPFTTFLCPWPTCCHGPTAITPGIRRIVQEYWALTLMSMPVWLMLPAACYQGSLRWSTAQREPAPVKNTGSKSLHLKKAQHWTTQKGKITLLGASVFCFLSDGEKSINWRAPLVYPSSTPACHSLTKPLVTCWCCLSGTSEVVVVIIRSTENRRNVCDVAELASFIIYLVFLCYTSNLLSQLTATFK